MTRHADETQIRGMVENWANAVRVKDMDGVLAYHASDIVMFDVPEPAQAKGIKEYEKTWELFFDSSPGRPGSFDVTELQVTASDRVAYCQALVNVVDRFGEIVPHCPFG
jgi:ketosteroid isomerase-like protein